MMIHWSDNQNTIQQRNNKMLLNIDEAEIAIKSVKVGVLAFSSATPPPKSRQKRMEKEPFQVESSFWMYVYFKSMFCDEVSQCVIKVCHKIQRKVHPLQRTTGQYSLSAAFLFLSIFPFHLSNRVCLSLIDNRYLLPNLNKVFRLWFFSLQQGNNWFLNRGPKMRQWPRVLYFP